MAGGRGVVVSKRDLLRIKVISMFRERKLSRQMAAEQLSLTVRQISRLAKNMREQGPEGLLHRGRGRSPSNKKRHEVRDKLIDLYRNKYKKFNFTHALEMMATHETLLESEKVSYSTFRRWCRAEGLGKVRKRRSSKGHVHRERMAEEGAMLQLDGSHHKWRVGSRDKDCLIAFIDDATSKVPYAKLHEGETTWACFDGLRRIIETQGIPQIILTDRAGWSDRGDKRFHFSQFARLCEDLGIILITTANAETKGRIERLNRTWQDRLIPELEFYGIHSRTDANRYIEQCFLPQWQEKFTVESESATKRYKPVPEWMDLNQYFSMQFKRIGNRNNTVSFEGKNYRILNREHGSLRKKEITVHKHQDGKIDFYYAGWKLDFEVIKPPKRKWGRAW